MAVKGMIMKKDGNTVAYNENSTLEDLSWQFAAGTAELAALG